MMVRVVAVSSFACVLGNGEVVAAAPGEQVSLPKDRADALVAAKLAKPLAEKSAPRNKSRSTEPRQTK